MATETHDTHLPCRHPLAALRHPPVVSRLPRPHLPLHRFAGRIGSHLPLGSSSGHIRWCCSHDVHPPHPEASHHPWHHDGTLPWPSHGMRHQPKDRLLILGNGTHTHLHGICLCISPQHTLARHERTLRLPWSGSRQHPAPGIRHMAHLPTQTHSHCLRHHLLPHGLATTHRSLQPPPSPLSPPLSPHAHLRTPQAILLHVARGQRPRHQLRLSRHGRATGKEDHHSRRCQRRQLPSHHEPLHA